MLVDLNISAMTLKYFLKAHDSPLPLPLPHPPFIINVFKGSLTEILLYDPVLFILQLNW